MKSQHQSFVIEAEAEDGIKTAQAWAEEGLKIEIKNNPDIIVLRYGLFSVEDARKVLETASSAPFVSEYKIVIISANRVFHEAQNALLKLFEEPPANTYIFLVLPTLGGLLPTLRSRVQVLKKDTLSGKQEAEISKAKEFLKADKEKRTAIIKKLTSGKDEEEKRQLREEAIALINGIELAVYEKSLNVGFTKPNMTEFLSEISVLREYMYDRSAPVKMILEHISFVIPKGLL